MLEALQQKRQTLRPVSQEEPAEKPPAAEAGMPLSADDLTEEAQQRIREEFFASGAEHWLPLLGDRSFETTSLPLSRQACAALVEASTQASGAAGAAASLAGSFSGLVQQIDDTLAAEGWQRAFVKLSTRSPKDAPQILRRAAAEFAARKALELPLQDRARLLAELVQAQFSVKSGQEALELLIASDRVREDLAYALEAPRYEDLNLHVVVRRYDGPIPIANEFRGIVWDGDLNALGQYYHWFVFPEVLARRAEIEADLRRVYSEVKPILGGGGYSHFIIDFAWLGPREVKIIEINPFDGKALGCFPGSTGLFRWDDASDRRCITQGPFEFRLRERPVEDHEIKLKLNTSWRDIVAPFVPARSGAAKARAAPRGGGGEEEVAP